MTISVAAIPCIVNTVMAHSNLQRKRIWSNETEQTFYILLILLFSFIK